MINPKYKIIKGTIYLQGHQSSFHNSITQALNLRPAEEGQLTYEITTDLIQSMRYKDMVFRVDYRLYPLTEPVKIGITPQLQVQGSE